MRLGCCASKRQRACRGWTRRVFQQTSVFNACWAALPAALGASLLKYFNEHVVDDFMSKIIPEDNIYQSFNFVVSFFIVFHTSHAYSRLMKSAENLYTAAGDLFDMTSLLVAFTRHSNASQEQKFGFMRDVVRLTSLLFSVSVAELEAADEEEKRAHRFRLVDAQGIDKDKLSRVLRSTHKEEVVTQMLLSLIVDNIYTGVLSIPPPLLTRAFQELGGSAVKFTEVRTYKEVSFPFPFIAAANFLLALHWITTPFFMCNWSKAPYDAGMYAFAVVFSIQLLHQVALELDDPFGSDANDINFERMQNDLNCRLLVILEEAGVDMDPTCVSAPLSMSMTTEYRSKDAFARFEDARGMSVGSDWQSQASGPDHFSQPDGSSPDSPRRSCAQDPERPAVTARCSRTQADATAGCRADDGVAARAGRHQGASAGSSSRRLSQPSTRLPPEKGMTAQQAAIGDSEEVSASGRSADPEEPRVWQETSIDRGRCGQLQGSTLSRC